jgi:hypothetical protein
VQPPWPVHAAGTPACLTRRFTDAIGGLWAPNTGSGFIEFKERLSVYIGIEPFQSCPTCEGDAVPNDGVRGGTCNGGPDNGLSCDVQGTDQAIDAGAGLSLDCFPDPLKNITGPSGVQLHVSFTTGALSLPSVETCDGPLAFLPCPCGVCSGDTSQACHTDTDCFGLGLGTCGAGDGNAAPRTPNSCSDLQCSDSGINELGVCNGDPPDMYCDATVRTDGSGILPCLTDVDCDAFGLICGGADCGNCTLAEKRRCFLDPIDATGVPHSTAPTLVAMTCIAQTTNVAVNAAMGLPGPTRLTLESTVAYEQ